MTNIAFTRELSLTDVKYGLISTIKSMRQYLPGKSVRFRILFDPPLQDGTTSFETCLDNLLRIREGQSYIQAFYEMHELKEGDLVYFEVLEPEQTWADEKRLILPLTIDPVFVPFCRLGTHHVRAPKGTWKARCSHYWLWMAAFSHKFGLETADSAGTNIVKQEQEWHQFCGGESPE